MKKMPRLLSEPVGDSKADGALRPPGKWTVVRYWASMNNFVSEPFGETYDLLAFPIGDRERLQCCAQMSAKSIPIRRRNGEVVMG